jgi:tetratricopeptide (TPR) repeat protein
MKKKVVVFLVACLVLLPSFVLAAAAKQPAALLQEGRYAEDIDGNLDKAIGIYEQIITDASADGAIKAQAMYLQGLCYLKKQDETKAQAVLNRLIEQFPQQTKLVEKAQVVLLELTDSDPAALMPPEILVYFELGSPGRQVETILNMLKGTPFENPLAAIGQGSQPAGQKSLGQVLNALMNPSMMTEFKKIRGMAMGITEIKQNNPSFVAVLYPGKSDAFRGLLMAGIGLAGQPAEPIEDMNVLSIQSIQSIQNTIGVAYDDTVIIVAQPMDLLKKSISLYKRKSSGPNLAENNKAFAEIGKATRKQNVLTVWAKVDQVFESYKKQQGQNLETMKLVDTFWDTQNIDELIATLSINNDAINCDAKINFKAGYQGFANLFRTPNLTKDGFANVPSEAVALVSFALSPNTGEKIQKPLERITGLDIGREIFNNIEQINIFVVPAAFTQSKVQSPTSLAECIGITITSKNPVQTNQILKKILGTFDAIAAFSAKEKNTEKSESQADKYMLPVGGSQKLYCFIGQNEKTTILTFSSQLLQSSQAGKSKSVLTSGPLQGAVGTLNPDTGKLVLLNAGGIIRIAELYLKAKNDNPDNPAYKTLEQIAALFDKTNIQIRTNERDDSFSIHAGIERIPPIKDLFPLIDQYSKAAPAKKTKATNPRPADKATIAASSTIKLQWTPGAAAVSHKVYAGSSREKLALLTETKENNCELKSPELGENAGYYWRVDEVWSDGKVITGDVWSFTAGGKLVGWWKLDGDANDSSGSGNHGTLINGPQPVAGRIGGALKFDGSDDYVDLPIGRLVSTLTRATIAVWVDFSNAGGPWQRILDFGTGTTNYIYLSPRTDTAGPMRVAITAGQGQWTELDASTGTLANGWHHVAVVLEPDNLKLYLDGKVVGSTSTLYVLSNLGVTTNNWLGRSQYSPDAYFNGSLDDLRIYNYVLGDKEIADIYQSALNPKAEGAEPK